MYLVGNEDMEILYCSIKLEKDIILDYHLLVHPITGITLLTVKKYSHYIYHLKDMEIGLIS